MKIKRIFKQIFGVSILVVICIVIFKIIDYGFNTIENGIKENPKYTIGTTTEYLDRGRGRRISYRYSLQGQLYHNSIDYIKTVKVPNGRYYVQYDSTSFAYSLLLKNRPVPDSITEAPANGWTEIPK